MVLPPRPLPQKWTYSTDSAGEINCPLYLQVQSLPSRGTQGRGRTQASRSRNRHRRSPSKYRKQIRHSSPAATSPLRRSQTSAAPSSSSSSSYQSMLGLKSDQVEQMCGKTASMSPENVERSPSGMATSGPTAMMQEYLKQLDGRQCKVVLKRHPVRPAPVHAPPEGFLLKNGKEHALKCELWMLIFSFLSQDDLSHCLCVSRVWNRWCLHASLWKTIDLSVTTIKKQHLCAIVRRQPAVLVLSSVVMTPKQLGWLLNRLPQLRELNLSHMSWPTISALCSSSCPLVQSLDLSWATELNEQCFKDLVDSPVSRTPGMDNKSRLSMLKTLLISGTEITDSNMKDLIQHVPKLENLTMSFCVKLTDSAIENLTKSENVKNHLKYLNISGCKQLTSRSLTHLINCVHLVTLNIERCPKITSECRGNFLLPSLKNFHW